MKIEGSRGQGLYPCPKTLSYFWVGSISTAESNVSSSSKAFLEIWFDFFDFGIRRGDDITKPPLKIGSSSEGSFKINFAIFIFLSFYDDIA